VTPAAGGPHPGHSHSPGPGPSHNGSPQRGSASAARIARPTQLGQGPGPSSGPAVRGSVPTSASQNGSAARSLAQPESAQWYDEDAGPLVRLYALTRGRARADDRVFSLLTMVAAQSAPYDDPTLGPEQARVLALCRNAPQSVAEIAASCDLPLGVTRVLLGDLLEIGHIRVRQPVPPADIFDERILQEVIDGLRAL
jgi:hypothetical protein